MGDPCPVSFLTVHHSFVYVYGDNCILADSWNSAYRPPDVPFRILPTHEDGFSIITEKTTSRQIGEKINRPIIVRKYELSVFQRYIDIMASAEIDPQKIEIVKNIFWNYRICFIYF